MALHTTILFIGLFALLQVPLTVMVIAYRFKAKVLFESGGDKGMMRRIRAHGNYTETVPITLLAMAAAEIAGLSPTFLWIGGLSLLIGRLSHVYALVYKGVGFHRTAGMLLTFAAMSGFALYDIAAYLLK